MRINHNISALNANNQLKANDNAISKNLKRLSSGYRINSAADDAAGLAISEKMRAQINGLNKAESNAEDGISLVQTAEGALSETQSILQRMNELAVESSNGTYQDGTDRENLDKEVAALKKEIDRISTSTNFNKINLLDGSLDGGEVTKSVANFTAPTGLVTGITDATNEVDTITVAGAALDHTIGTSADYTVNYTDASGNSQSVTVTLINQTPTADFALADVGAALKSALDGTDVADYFDITDNTDGTLTMTAKVAGEGEGTIDSISAKFTGTTTAVAGATAVQTNEAEDAYQTITGASFDATDSSKNSFTVNGQRFAFVATADEAKKLDSDVAYVVTAGAPDAAAATSMAALIEQKTGLKAETDSGTTTNINVFGKVSSTSEGGLTLQIGSSNAADQRVSLSIGDMSSTGLGISGISIDSQGDALASIDTISDALDKVSKTRADLGALQNRLEHSVNNLRTSSQNLTSAESRIRDVDMSSEMVQLTKNQILEQAATSMLAQANSLPQSVLSLLKG